MSLEQTEGKICVSLNRFHTIFTVNFINSCINCVSSGIRAGDSPCGSVKLMQATLLGFLG